MIGQLEANIKTRWEADFDQEILHFIGDAQLVNSDVLTLATKEKDWPNTEALFPRQQFQDEILKFYCVLATRLHRKVERKLLKMAATITMAESTQRIQSPSEKYGSVTPSVHSVKMHSVHTPDDQPNSTSVEGYQKMFAGCFLRTVEEYVVVQSALLLHIYIASYWPSTRTTELSAISVFPC